MIMAIDKIAEGWIYNQARKNYWRVASWYELDDLIQDGLMTWVRVANHYKDRVQDRKHMMRLFQISYVNHINDLATDRTRHADFNHVYDDEIMKDFAHDLELATLHTLCAQAPPQIKAVLNLLASADGCKRLRAQYRIKNGKRETLNERLCRLIELPCQDLVGMIRSHFGEVKT